MLPRKSDSLRARVAAAGHDEPVLTELLELLGDDAHDRGGRGMPRGRGDASALREALLDALRALAHRAADEQRRRRRRACARGRRRRTRRATNASRCDTRPVSVTRITSIRPRAELDELDVRDVRARERRVLDDRDLAGQLGERADGAHEDVVEVARPVEERRRSRCAAPAMSGRSSARWSTKTR